MMQSIYKAITISFLAIVITACNNKPNPVADENKTETIVIDSLVTKNKESIEGLYETKPDPNNTGECKMSVEIKKDKNGYTYFLKTQLRKLKGIALFSKNESGEKYIILEGIKWDDYEGDITREEESDSVSNKDTKELEIPVGIDLSYTKDTLTIQNYGNPMNSYTKISECNRKYIELIRK